MTPADITAIVVAVTGVIVGILMPVVMRRRQLARESSSVEVVSWQGITAVLQKERDELRRQLDEIDDEYKARIRAMDADYTAQLTTARARIHALETEVAELYGRLGRAGGGRPSASS